MKLLYLFLLLSKYSICQMTIEGNYCGKNLYFQNPECDYDYPCFCVDSVFVNGKKISFDLNMAAFELKLTELNLVENEKIVIQLFHYNECKPKLLINPCWHPKNHVEFLSIEYKDGQMNLEKK